MDAELVRLILGLVYVLTVLLVVGYFRKPIASLLERLKSFELPGGGKAELESQAERSAEDMTKPPVANPSLPASGEQATNAAPEEQQKLVDQLNSYTQLAYFWEYKYLNLFLVRRTQILLDWLISINNPVTIQLVDASMGVAIPPHERAAMVSALQTHYLIQIEDGLIKVTPKGREYVATRGPLAPPNITMPIS